MTQKRVTLAPGESKPVSIDWGRWMPQEPMQGPPLPEFLKIFWPWYTPLGAEFEEMGFDLTRPTASPAEVAPGTDITITCPITSRCTGVQTATAKVIIYEGSILPGHGSVIATKTSPPFSISPGETYDVIAHHTAIAGTIDRRDVEVEVYIVGKLIKQSEWDDVYYVTAPAPVTIVDATWSVSGVSGVLGGMLVKGVLTINSPKAFVGKVTVAIPDSMIASNVLLTPEQQQALLAYNEQKRSECSDSTCRHHYDLILASRGGDPLTGGFYDSGINGRETREDVEEHHVNNIAKGVSSRTYPHMAGMYLGFPEGTSQIILGFFMKADETEYNLGGDDEVRYCIACKGGVFSPEVRLYEGSTTLVDKVIYTDAISFGEWYTGNRCTLPWGAYPVSASVPAFVRSGEYSFLASHTVYLTYMEGYEYKPELYVRVPYSFKRSYDGKIITAYYDWTIAYRDLYCGLPWNDRILSLPGTGEYTFEGLIGTHLTWDYEYGVKSPAWAMYSRGGLDIVLWFPVPPGTYPVLSRCWKRRGPPGFQNPEKIWDEPMGINIEVT